MSYKKKILLDLEIPIYFLVKIFPGRMLMYSSMDKFSQNKVAKSLNIEANPTSLQIELFANDLIQGIEDIINITGRYRAKDYKNVKSRFNFFVTRLIKLWGSSIPLEKVNHEEKGINLIFKGLNSSFLVPAHFWLARNSLKTNIKAFKNYVDNFPVHISWDTFQRQVSDLLQNPEMSTRGLSRRDLEILRFYARFSLESPAILYMPDPQLRRIYFDKYYLPVYLKSLTMKQLNKNFLQTIDKFSFYDVVPVPKLWNVADILVDSTSYNENYEINLRSLPIWAFKGYNQHGKSFFFAFHRISLHTLPEIPNLIPGLASSMHLFWNMNWYKQSARSTDRYQLHLPSPTEIYSTFKKQNNSLADSFCHKSKERFDQQSKKTPIFAPDWELQLDYPLSSTIIDENPKDSNLQLKTLKNFNLRYIDTTHTFFKDFQHSHTLKQLFKERLYFYKLPPATRGVIWIPLPKNYPKDIKTRLINFLKAWLHKGPIIVTPQGILVITYFPKDSMNTDFLQQIETFFMTTFKVPMHIFIQDTHTIEYMSSFSIYSLPQSNYFDPKSQTWNLPQQKLFPSEDEKIQSINQIIAHEQQATSSLTH